MQEEVWLTYRGAAKRVGRAVRTIQRWVASGMPAEFDERGRRIVREEVLLAEFRRRLDAWPPHQHRLRRMQFDTPTDGWS